MINTIFAFINAAIIQSIPLLFGATGEIITEKSGNLNLGIPGIMYMGGISGIIGGYLYEHSTDSPAAALCIIIPLLSSLIGSTLMALIYSFLTVTLRVNQHVTGLALTTFGIGIGNFFGGSLLSFFGETGSISLIKTGYLFASKNLSRFNFFIIFFRKIHSNQPSFCLWQLFQQIVLLL